MTSRPTINGTRGEDVTGYILGVLESLETAAELVQTERYEEAEALLATFASTTPDDLRVHGLLAQVRFLRGDPDFARSLRVAASREGAPTKIHVAHADTLRRSGQLDSAEELLREIVARHGPRPDALNSLGLLLQETRRWSEAVAVARQASEALPKNENVAENLVSALLSAGEARAALPIIERFGAQSPLDQRWITYRADVARHCGESHYDEWCDLDRFVRVYDLEPPAPYRSMDELHAELRPALEARHRHASHPLDQTLRGGTETSLGLLAATEPVVQAFLEALAVPIAAYQSEIGRAADHPLLARNTSPARLVGCWSVRLRRDGFHVNHIHPMGWISSAYYVAVPSEVEDVTAQSGWIKFGEPYFPQPEGKVGRVVQPRAGRLVLFPSYLWHGTTPIRGEEPRLTAAFDAVPFG